MPAASPPAAPATREESRPGSCCLARKSCRDEPHYEPENPEQLVGLEPLAEESLEAVGCSPLLLSESHQLHVVEFRSSGIVAEAVDSPGLSLPELVN